MVLFINMKDILDSFLTGNIRAFVEAIGLFGVYAVAFAESGLLVGFFLPGDSLLFTAGFLASPAIGLLNIWPLVLGTWVAAILGDNVGYEFGKRVGPKLFSREDSLIFKRAHALKAQAFYDKHGPKTIVLARFMPIVRTFAPIVAGIANMNFRVFFFYNLLGSLLWTFGLVLLGYSLGSVIDVDRYLLPIIVFIVIISFLPAIIGYIRERMMRRKSTETAL